MVKLGMRVIYSERIFVRCDIVSQHEVKLKIIAALSCYGSDRVMRRTVRFGKNKRALIGIPSPFCEYLIAEIDEPFVIERRYSYNGHRPFYPACFNVLIAIENELLLNGSFLHCEGISSALKMLVSEYRTADYRQIGVRADKIMRELLNKIKQL